MSIFLTVAPFWSTPHVLSRTTTRPVKFIFINEINALKRLLRLAWDLIGKKARKGNIRTNVYNEETS